MTSSTGQSPLLRHSAAYLVGRGVPALLNLFAIMLFTRAFSLGEYGFFAVVVAMATVFGGVLFWWLSYGLIRLFPVHPSRASELLSSVAVAYTALALVVVLTVTVAMVLLPSHRLLMAVAAFIILTQSWFELELQLARITFAPFRYATLGVLKALAFIVFGAIAALLGAGALGLLLAFGLGSLTASLAGKFRYFNLGGRKAELSTMSSLAKYGIPLTVSFLLASGIYASDKIMLALLSGPVVVGAYAAASEVTFRSIVLLMVAVDLASFPLALRALEVDFNGALRQLKDGLGLLLAVTIPALATFVILAGSISAVLFGAEFEGPATQVMPLLATAAFLAGIKDFYLNRSFQLGRNTLAQIWPVLLGLIANISLNLLLIPRYGARGAAMAAVLALLISAILAWRIGAKVFRLPGPGIHRLGAILVATTIMVIVVWPLSHFRGPLLLIFQLGLSGAVYLAALMAIFPPARASFRGLFSRLHPKHYEHEDRT